ncbi:MAG: hypothetical protein HFH08_05045 [Bacilli bacterium]|nr:hypothetical protein [Bacilli bacterium]
MEQQVVVLNGIIYDYCEKMKFYKMLGVLDGDTGMFRGIEFLSDSLESKSIKEKLAEMDPALVNATTGFIEEQQIGYYTLDMGAGVACYTQLEPSGNDSLHGKVQVERILTEKTESKFKTSSALEYCKDEELLALLSRIFSSQQPNFLWNQLQESITQKRKSQKVKVLNA